MQRLIGLSYLVTSLLASTVALGQSQPNPIQEHAHELSCLTFPPDLTESDLIERYGADNVSSAPVFGSDDGPQDGTVVFPDVEDMKLEINWVGLLRTGTPPSVDRTARPSWVRSQEYRSRWRTPHGIAVGMDLKTIERMNGRPFRLNGFVQFGGDIASWGAGKLKSVDADDCKIRIILFPTSDGPRVPRWLVKQVHQHKEFSSGHPAMQALNPRVVSIYVEPQRR